MARLRPTGRFYFLLTLLICVIAYFVYQQIPERESTAYIQRATSQTKHFVDAVIVRDEVIASFEGLEKVEHVAKEGSYVALGDPVADIYATSYIAKEQNKLVSTRESIRDYHRGLFAESTDSTLERLDENVYLKAQELKHIVTGHGEGNMANLSADLAKAMQERQEYLSLNFMDDTKLMQLYQDESKRVSSMSSWKSASAATREGIVYFYFDGYEGVLNSSDFTSLSADTLRRVLQGDTSVQTQKSKRSEQVYRIVSDEIWYVALISRDAGWAPVTGQELTFVFTGFEDILYSGTVIGVQRSGSDVIVQLSCTDPIGPMLYQRSGEAEIGVSTTGLMVPAEALFYQNEQPGVWVGGSYGITFVPVDILSQNRENAIIQPMQSDALYEGQEILIY